MRHSLVSCVAFSLVLSLSSLQAQEMEAAALPNIDVESRAGDYLGGSITRAIFTRAVVNREPIDNLDQLPADVKFVYFFTELKGFTGEVITHRWEHEGSVVEEARFEVGGPRWRVWSSRPLPDGSKGVWRVKVLDFEGREISSSEFNYDG